MLIYPKHLTFSYICNTKYFKKHLNHTIQTFFDKYKLLQGNLKKIHLIFQYDLFDLLIQIKTFVYVFIAIIAYYTRDMISSENDSYLIKGIYHPIGQFILFFGYIGNRKRVIDIVHGGYKFQIFNNRQHQCCFA